MLFSRFSLQTGVFCLGEPFTTFGADERSKLTLHIIKTLNLHQDYGNEIELVRKREKAVMARGSENQKQSLSSAK
jgi:hypothetical protein